MAPDPGGPGPGRTRREGPTRFTPVEGADPGRGPMGQRPAAVRAHLFAGALGLSSFSSGTSRVSRGLCDTPPQGARPAPLWQGGPGKFAAGREKVRPGTQEERTGSKQHPPPSRRTRTDPTGKGAGRPRRTLVASGVASQDPLSCA
ncbi:hypothetical protein NDU88_006043 [Pleurodeles waltl]|uniref:Uncharacterized protein n=1 Tax=Pleurodeles waltl TaxID=8319 RepID=A0AAV7MZR9_PLEWA|nr:hypothetical protein NDU88_006043 [Pleurodeles waltl]